MEAKDVKNLMEAYASLYTEPEVYGNLDEAYKEPKFGKKRYIEKLSKRGGMGTGQPGDPHGYRDPKMANVGSELSKRKTAAAKAKKTGEPDSYRAEKESQSKYQKEEFETWVNALVEEGYDLSEYTWDDMYEIYMEEVENLDEITSSMGRRAKKYREDQAQAAHMASLAAHKERMKNDPEYARKHEEARTVHQRAHERSEARKNAEGETQKESYDLFDYILEHLVAEGYADTNEAALAIMANMSEEWKQSIVEETKRTEYLQKKFNKENERKSGSALKHIPGKQNTGQALQKARESERHMRGER
jgi:hypothetical protein